MRYRRTESGAGISSMRNAANIGGMDSESNTASMSMKERSTSHN